MLVHITNGTYGHRPRLPNGKHSTYVVPVTRDDAPIDVDEEEAQRLVELGVAELVAVEPVATAADAAETENPGVNTPAKEAPKTGQKTAKTGKPKSGTAKQAPVKKDGDVPELEAEDVVQ